MPSLLVLLEAKRALGSSWAGQGMRFCWDKGAWLLQQRDIWVISGRRCKVPPAWDSAPQIAVAVVATAGIKNPQGPRSSLWDTEALSLMQMKDNWQIVF